MYRFALRPVWLLSHLFSLALVVAFVSLGFWQLDRHDQKVERNATITDRADQPAAPVDDVLADAVRTGDDDDENGVGDLRYRNATAVGTYVAGADVLIDNRSNDGLPGAWIVTPLRLEDGTTLAVSRGFQQFDSGVIDPPAPPAGRVEVTGTVLPWDTRNCGIRTDDADTPIGSACLRRDAVEGLLGGPVLPVVVQRVESNPVDADVLVPVPLPELSLGSHRSYAAQWFIFAAIGTIGYPLILRRVAREKANGLVPDGNRASADPDAVVTDVTLVSPGR